MTYQLAKLMLSIAKPIKLLLIFLYVQVNIGQQAVAAKNAFRFQSDSSIVLAKSSEANSFCPNRLSTAIEAITNRPQFSRVRWGILIQTLASDKTLYSRDAKKYFIPASNVKLLTTAAALHQLGAQFRIRTSVYGTKDGFLRVVGRGDPSLTDIQLRELAQQLSRQGIHQVKQVIAEDDYFQGYTVNPSWEWEDIQADYGAPVNSLILNQNALTLTFLPQQLGKPLLVRWGDPAEATRWRIENNSLTSQLDEPASLGVSRDVTGGVLKITGSLNVNSVAESVSLAVIDPVAHFIMHFRRALLAEDVVETTDTHRYTQTSADTELAAVESPPLSVLLVETNQNSNNLYAEALLRTLGVELGKMTTSTDATAQLGIDVIKSTLTELGVDPSGYILADGSGLSRHNLVSPEALVQTLKVMARSSQANVYRASLPVAGISGTLKNRFRDSDAQGIVRAKTGTMSGIVALSGYLDAPEYEPLVFSIIVNQSDRSAVILREAIDEMVLRLTRLHRC